MFNLRVTLLGDAAVGKTSIRKRFMGDGFSTNYQETIGADFAIKKLILPDKTEVRFQIWDLPGQMNYQNVRSVFYIGSMGGLVIYDYTRESTLKNIRNWVNELWKHCGTGKIPVILLGNKFDLINQFPNSVDENQGIQYAQELSKETEEIKSKVIFFNTSAKTGLNIDKAFYTLAECTIAYLQERRSRRKPKRARKSFKV